MSSIATKFKERFVAALPELPAHLDLHLDEFVVFDPAALPGHLSKEDSDFLVAQGLPCDAAPFLSFYAYSQPEIDSRKHIFGIPDSCFPIGHNGSGDVLAIDMDSQEIIYFNHDHHNERVFINSSLPQFAECLCVFQEHLTGRTIASCLDAIAVSDPRAASPGAMWHAEVISAAADEA